MNAGGTGTPLLKERPRVFGPRSPAKQPDMAGARAPEELKLGGYSRKEAKRPGFSSVPVLNVKCSPPRPVTTLSKESPDLKCRF